MKPYIICHMITSLDGRLSPRLWSKSPDGERSDWSAIYEAVHNELDADGWIVGRVTMAEMSKGTPSVPKRDTPVERPQHFADRDASAYAIVVDRSGKLHFGGPDIGGDHVVVLLGGDVSDAHLAELAANGVSYLVADGPELDLPAMLATIGRELGIRRLLLEGGGGINGSFLAAGVVDEISLLVAPAIDGRDDSRGIFMNGQAGLAEAARLSLRSLDKLAHGMVHLRYSVEAADPVNALGAPSTRQP